MGRQRPERRNGRGDFIVLCTQHKEKTPSLWVRRGGGFYCYGCAFIGVGAGMNDPLPLNFDSQDIVVVCPSCGNNWNHYTVVDVYSRTALGSKVTRIGGDDMQPLGNPSKHQDGLTIGFSCERCPQTFWLCIAQHKGEVYLSMERGEEVEVKDEEPSPLSTRELPANVRRLREEETVADLLRRV